MTGSEFWDSSLPEIYDRIESHNRQIKHEVSMQFMFSEIILNRLGYEFDHNIKLLMPWDYYPQLFEENQREYEAEREKEEFLQFKEKRRMMMMCHNQRYQRKEGENEQ